MGAKTLTISINEEDWAYLQDNDLLSPSKIFRSAMFQIKEGRSSLKKENKLLWSKNKILQEKVFELQDVLEKEKSAE